MGRLARTRGNCPIDNCIPPRAAQRGSVSREKRHVMEKQKEIANAVQARFEQEVLFLQRLVQTKSSNAFLPGTSSPGVPIEKEVAAVIERELLQLGFEPELVGVSSQRPN